MYPRKGSMVFAKGCLVAQECFLLHIKAACQRKFKWSYHSCRKYISWNLENSSAFNSSLDKMRLTTCCGRRVKDPRLRTSLPWSSTNCITFIAIVTPDGFIRISSPCGWQVLCTCIGYIYLRLKGASTLCQRLCRSEYIVLFMLCWKFRIPQ